MAAAEGQTCCSSLMQLTFSMTWRMTGHVFDVPMEQAEWSIGYCCEMKYPCSKVGLLHFSHGIYVCHNCLLKLFSSFLLRNFTWELRIIRIKIIVCWVEILLGFFLHSKGQSYFWLPSKELVAVSWKYLPVQGSSTGEANWSFYFYDAIQYSVQIMELFW